MYQCNPFVAYLNRFTTASPEHEAAFDEFVVESRPPVGEPLKLETGIEKFIRGLVSGDSIPSIILTGNAGDGKTYLCRQIIGCLGGEVGVDWNARSEWGVSRSGLTLHVLKDLSEVDEATGRDVLAGLSASLEEPSPKSVYLIAANEGRLRAVLSDPSLDTLFARVDRQLAGGRDLDGDRLLVINLNEIATSNYVSQVLSWLTAPEHWEACTGCPGSASCPIANNAESLSGEHVAERITLLYQMIEHLKSHITVRDMLIHLAFAITGGLTCSEMHTDAPGVGRKGRDYSYFENLVGTAAGEAFRAKIAPMAHLRRLNLGGHSLYEVDDFIVNGAPESAGDQAEYERLFAPAPDLGGKIFAQARDSYLRAGTTSVRSIEEHPLFEWLPAMRRKLFFEWRKTDRANQLIQLKYLPQFLKLLTGDRGALERARRGLVLGLNRAFSRLFITDDRSLCVTSQYSNPAERPVPIVRVQIPAEYITLSVRNITVAAYETEHFELMLTIPPPPTVALESITWRVDLLRFEYLLRLANGGTFNILAEECELAIRRLKDQLLTTFASGSEEGRQITFFVPEKDRYTLRALWIEENDTLRGGRDA